MWLITTVNKQVLPHSHFAGLTDCSSDISLLLFWNASTTASYIHYSTVHSCMHEFAICTLLTKNFEKALHRFLQYIWLWWFRIHIHSNCATSTTMLYSLLLWKKIRSCELLLYCVVYHINLVTCINIYGCMSVGNVLLTSLLYLL